VRAVRADRFGRRAGFSVSAASTSDYRRRLKTKRRRAAEPTAQKEGKRERDCYIKNIHIVNKKKLVFCSRSHDFHRTCTGKSPIYIHIRSSFILCSWKRFVFRNSSKWKFEFMTDSHRMCFRVKYPFTQINFIARAKSQI